MATGPEGRFSDSIQKELRRRGAWVYKPPAGPRGRKGVPDLIGCYAGRFFAWELKAGSALTVLQAREVVKITDAGGDARVVRAVPAADVPRLVEHLLAELAPDPTQRSYEE